MSIEAIKYSKTLIVPRKLGMSLIAIAENTFNDSCTCKIGYDRLSRDARCSLATLKRHLIELGPTELGIIRVEPRWKPGYGGRDHSIIHLIGFRESPEISKYLERKLAKQAAQNELYAQSKLSVANSSETSGKQLISTGHTAQQVSCTNNRTSNRTNIRTQTRSRADKGFNCLIKASASDWVRIWRNTADWAAWTQDLEIRGEKALAQLMNSNRVFAADVPSYRPRPDSPLPIPYLPTATETSSAVNGANRQHSKAKSNA